MESCQLDIAWAPPPPPPSLASTQTSLSTSLSLQVAEGFVQMEQEEQSCQLDITLAYEVFSEPKAMMLYPINALRNLARLQVWEGRGCE